MAFFKRLKLKRHGLIFASFTVLAFQNCTALKATSSSVTLSSSESPIEDPPAQELPPLSDTKVGCDSEGSLDARTDILKCEPWESEGWWQEWWGDKGDTGDSLDGRRFNRYPVRAEHVTGSAVVSSDCVYGNCLKVNMNGWNSTTPGFLSVNWIIPGLGGCSHATLGCVPQQEVYMRYYFKLSPNFEPDGYTFDSYYTGTGGGIHEGGGGKFPGLADALNGSSYAPTSIQCGNGGEGPTEGTECWSLRTTYQPCHATFNGTHNVCAENGNPEAKTRLGLYPYMYNNGIIGGTRYSAAYFDDDGRGSMSGPCTDTFGFGGGKNGPYASGAFCGSGVPGLLNNRWYLYEMHVKMNDPGVANGIIEAWIDGALKYKKTNAIFRNVGHNNIGVRQFWLDVYEGGSGVAMKEDMSVTFDQMVLSTKSRVGPWSAHE
jgi:hypothetical protein